MEEEFTFDGQRPQEKVIFVLRRHPWVLARAGFILIIFIIALTLAILFYGLSTVTSFIILIAVLLFIGFGFYQWFLYNNYLNILTDERIIIIEQIGLFNRKITEAELEKIQNITVEVKGIAKTILNFGDIIIRTAGIDPIMILSNVDNPYEVQQRIIKHCKSYPVKPSNERVIIR